MSLEIKGKITEVLEPQTGEGKNGQWRKQEYILETHGEYPKSICFEMWNDSIVPLELGQEVTASINIESREYNGRWYTNIKAWKIEAEQASPKIQQPQPKIDIEPEEGDDLPF